MYLNLYSTPRPKVPCSLTKFEYLGFLNVLFCQVVGLWSIESKSFCIIFSEFRWNSTCICRSVKFKIHWNLLFQVSNVSTLFKAIENSEQLMCPASNFFLLTEIRQFQAEIGVTWQKKCSKVTFYVFHGKKM